MPCDTIYGMVGLTGNAENKIRSAKGRDEGKPFIRLISSREDLEKYSIQSVSSEILDLWPGPLTLIVKSRAGGTEAFRVPDDEYLLELLRLVDKPVVSTSVNFTGSPSLNSIEDIISQFENLVDAVIDGGDASEEASASTILDVTSKPYKVVRNGPCIIPENLL